MKTRLPNRLTVAAVPRFKKVLAMRDAGVPVPEIARAMGGLSRARIYRMIHQALAARELKLF